MVDRKYISFQCKCGAKYNNKKDQMICTANHLGMTLDDYLDYIALQQAVKYNQLLYDKNPLCKRDYEFAQDKLNSFVKKFKITKKKFTKKGE